MSKELNRVWDALGLRYKSHPWHGVEIGDGAPEIVTSFIEVIPTDTVKYEIDKKSGYLMVDRPQKFSNIIPALYGFVPQTYCDTEVAKLCKESTGRDDIIGDGDPLDICVLTERNITHGNVLVPARIIGGFRMIDGGEADDKIIAVLNGDQIYEGYDDVTDIPESVINRLKHYFLTYKNMPGQPAKCEITETYGKKEALRVVEASRVDYMSNFGIIEDKLSEITLEALETRNA